jgi:hypothetical protein
MFERVTDNAPWAGRGWFRALNFNGRLLIYGGRNNAFTYFGDVWETGNGEDWTQVHQDVAGSIGQRASYGACIHNRRLYVSNGLPTITHDVYHALGEGLVTQDTAAAAWSARYDGEMCSFDQHLWVIGGQAGGTRVNDVWKSRDGVQWTQVLATGHTMWTAREDHRVVVHNGAMWIIGGIDNNGSCSDVWYSTDGVRWIQAISLAPFGALANHAVVSYDRRLVVVTQECKLWHSLDGTLWEGGALAEMPARGEFALEVFDNRIYLLGGNQGATNYNDVWRTVGTEF